MPLEKDQDLITTICVGCLFNVVDCIRDCNNRGNTAADCAKRCQNNVLAKWIRRYAQLKYIKPLMCWD